MSPFVQKEVHISALFCSFRTSWNLKLQFLSAVLLMNPAETGRDRPEIARLFGASVPEIHVVAKKKFIRYHPIKPVTNCYQLLRKALLSHPPLQGRGEGCGRVEEG
jgi:hypothetical protein